MSQNIVLHKRNELSFRVHSELSKWNLFRKYMQCIINIRKSYLSDTQLLKKSWISHFYLVKYGTVIGKVVIRKNTAGGLAPNYTQ